MKKVILFHLSMLIGFCSMPCIAQTNCTDFSYTVTYDEYRTVADNTSIQDVGELNLYKFKNKTKKKHVRKFVNDKGDPVKVTAIIDAVNYYPQTVQLPLISVYGETDFYTVINSFDQVEGLSEGTLGKRQSWSQSFSSNDQSFYTLPAAGTRTNFGTIINNFQSYSAGSFYQEDYLSTFQQNVTYHVPSSQELTAFANANFLVSNSGNEIIIEGNGQSIMYDLINHSIRYNYPDGSYQHNSYSQAANGEYFLNTSTNVSFETLVNGLCTELIVTQTYGDYACLDQSIQFNEREFSSLKLYPNPTNEYLNITLSDNYFDELLIFTIRDLSGRVLGTFNLLGAKQLALPVQDIISSDGMYTITIESENNFTTQKFFFTNK